MVAYNMAAFDLSHFVNFEHVKIFSSHFADFEQVKNFNSYFSDFEQVKIFSSHFATLNNNNRFIDFLVITQEAFKFEKDQVRDSSTWDPG